MKSIVKNAEVQQEVTYPCLKEFCTIGGRIVVLFNSHLTGFVVSSANDGRPIGYFTDSWSESNFKPFTGTIELSN